MKLLHIIATPREQSSNTLRISNALLTILQEKHPELEVQDYYLFDSDLPAVAGNNIESKYHLMKGLKIDKAHENSWKEIDTLALHFLQADLYVISSPMWNFNVPYALKFYIDCIVQPGYLFKYDEMGIPHGLATNKKMVCITTHGGDYSQAPMNALNFQEPYLRAIFGFCGITNMQFISAQPMDFTPEIREHAILAAIEEAKSLAINYDWTLSA